MVMVMVPDLNLKSKVMKKLLLLSFILFSFLSYGQTTIKKPLVDTLGTTIQLMDSGRYLLLVRNSKYRYAFDLISFSFSNKVELNKFIDTLTKYTSVENYSDNFKGARLETIIDGNKISFTLDMKDYTRNPNYEEQLKIYNSASNRDKKKLGFPKNTISEPSIELTIFSNGNVGGWSYFRKIELDIIKSKIN
jgi:hypothetical protein